MPVEVILELVIFGLLIGGVYMLMAIGMTLVFGVMKIVNFAQGVFVLIGAYITFFLSLMLHIDPLLTVFPAAAILGLIGYAVYRTTLVPLFGRSDFEADSALVTFAVSLVIENLVLIYWTADTRSVYSTYANTGIRVLAGFDIPESYLVSFVVTMMALAMLYQFLYRTRFGRALRATSQDVVGASLVGIDANFVYIMSFVLASALSGVSGTLVSLVYSFDPTFGFTLLLVSFGITIVGGLGDLRGAAIASLAIGVLQAFTEFYATSYTFIVLYATILVAVLVRGRLRAS